MTEHDADDADSDTANGESEGQAENVAESLEEIAERPDDADAELTAIMQEAETGADDTGTSERTDPQDVDVDDGFVDTVAETSPEKLARAIVTLRTEVSSLEDQFVAERERAADLESRLKRKQADFQNYKKRQQEKMEEEKQRATEDLVERLLDVRDNLQRALDQDEDADIRGGVETTLEQFDRELDRENVSPIEPEPGDSVDPQRHEVLQTVESDQPADEIAGVHRPGYEMAGKVIRAAQVTVSDGSNHADGDDRDGDTRDDGTDE